MTNDNMEKERATVFAEETKRTAGSAVITGFFTGSALTIVLLSICLVISLIFAGPVEGILISASVIIAGIAGGILQQLFFNYRPAFRMAYSTRLFLFAITYFAVLLGCAFLGNWFPKDIPGAWVLFVAIFLVILLLTSLIIGRALKKRGIEYKTRLDDYHETRKPE